MLDLYIGSHPPPFQFHIPFSTANPPGFRKHQIVVVGYHAVNHFLRGALRAVHAVGNGRLRLLRLHLYQREYVPRIFYEYLHVLTHPGNMYIYTSDDALNFSLLKGPAYVRPIFPPSPPCSRPNAAQVPTTGLIRDPSIIRHTDGDYYVSYTTNWEGRDFAIARSSNLLNWTLHTTVSISDTTQARTWAPEIFQDPRTGETNIIVSLGESLTTFNPYLYTATDDTLTSWSGPVAMAGIGPNYIDTFIVWDEDSKMYHAYTKNETSKYLEHAVATSLAGPWTFVQTGIYSPNSPL
jgi:hypothetical protein